MSSAGVWHPGRLWSLLEMMELQAGPFLGSVTQLRHLINLIEKIDDINRAVVFSDHLQQLSAALRQVGARSALSSVNRLRDRIQDNSKPLSYAQTKLLLEDIESRFADHLQDIKFFVLNEGEAALFESSDKLLGIAGTSVDGFSRAFPNASFEIEEAAKCMALERHTAVVFHCMRALECGIKSIARFLNVPDPVKPAEKNWGTILKTIRLAIDQKFPVRLPNSTGAKLDLLFANLDAVKNPWRNATMHVENVYAPHEALHILRCVGMFLLELVKICDEEGIAPADSAANATVGVPTSSL